MSVLCPNCSKYVADGKFCPFCGYDLRKHAEAAGDTLKPGTTLCRRYVVDSVLGRGEFGVSYSGFDNRANSSVIIIEYLPSGSARRDSAGLSLFPSSPEKKAEFDSGKAEFLHDVNTLTELGEGDYHAKIVEHFEQNGTVYCVSEYLRNVDPGEYLPHAFYPEKTDAAAESEAAPQPVPPVVEVGSTIPVPPVVEVVGTAPVPPVVEVVDTAPVPPVVEVVDTAPVPPVVEVGNTMPIPPVVEFGGTQPVPPVVEVGNTMPIPPVVDYGSTQPVPPVVDYGSTQPVPPVVDVAAPSGNMQGSSPASNSYYIADRKQKKKPPFLWIGIGAAALVVIILIALLAGGGKKDKKEKPAASSSPKVTATAKPSAAPAEEDEEDGDENEETAPAPAEDVSVPSLAGSYKMTRWLIGGQDFTDDLANFDILNMRPTLEIDKDNVGILDMLDEQKELRFDPKEMTVTSVKDGKSAPFTFEDGVIAFTLNSEEMEFTPADRVKPADSGGSSDAGSPSAGNSGSGSPSAAAEDGRAADAVSLSFGDTRYNAGYWLVPTLAPDTPIENCTGFTLCFRYDSVDTSVLGQHRVYVCINKRNNAWQEKNRVDIPEQGVVYRIDIRMDKGRNIDAISLLPVKAIEGTIEVTAWIENITYAK